MARTTDHSETLAERIAFVIAFTNSTMPIAIRVSNESEAVEARRLLALSKNKAAKIVSVIVKEK